MTEVLENELKLHKHIITTNLKKTQNFYITIFSLHRKTRKFLQIISKSLGFKISFVGISIRLSFNSPASLIKTLNYFNQIRGFGDFNLSFFSKRFPDQTLIKEAPIFDFFDDVFIKYYKNKKSQNYPYFPENSNNEDFNIILEEDELEIFKNSFLDLLPLPVKKKGFKYLPLTKKKTIPRPKELKAFFNKQINQVALSLGTEANFVNNFLFVDSINFNQTQQLYSKLFVKFFNSSSCINEDISSTITQLFTYLTKLNYRNYSCYCSIFNFINLMTYLQRLQVFTLLSINFIINKNKLN